MLWQVNAFFVLLYKKKIHKLTPHIIMITVKYVLIVISFHCRRNLSIWRYFSTCHYLCNRVQQIYGESGSYTWLCCCADLKTVVRFFTLAQLLHRKLAQGMTLDACSCNTLLAQVDSHITSWHTQSYFARGVSFVKGQWWLCRICQFFQTVYFFNSIVRS